MSMRCVSKDANTATAKNGVLVYQHLAVMTQT